MGFLTQYQAVFTAVQTALKTKTSIKTVILGEAFTLGDLPKAIINAEDAPISQATQGYTLAVKVNFSVILVIQDYTPKDWFTDIIPVMADVVDAILADRTLAGSVMDVTPTGFYPGEIHFAEEKKDTLLFGGQVSFTADLLFTP